MLDLHLLLDRRKFWFDCLDSYCPAIPYMRAPTFHLWRYSVGHWGLPDTVWLSKGNRFLFLALRRLARCRSTALYIEKHACLSFPI
jgi:hypothetical protein